MSEVKSALNEAIESAGSEDTKKKLRLLNIYTASHFEYFIKELKKVVRDNFPKYAEYLKYL